MIRPFGVLAFATALLAAAPAGAQFRIFGFVNNEEKGVAPTNPAPFLHWDLREFANCKIPWSVADGVPDLDLNQTADQAADRLLARNVFSACFAAWEAVNPAVVGFQLGNFGAAVGARQGIAVDQYNLLSFVGDTDDDVQVVPVGGAVAAGGVVVHPGLNGRLETQPAGDDIMWACITTGPNGVCATAAAGADTQVIPVGQGRPNTRAISTGADGISDTAAAGDDVQIIPVGQGKPNTIGVFLNGGATAPAGDDVLSVLAAPETAGFGGAAVQLPAGTIVIRTGPNGICNTAAAAPDVQVIANGNGLRSQTGVDSGANGVCNTAPALGDLFFLAVGRGEPNAVAVLAGPTGNLATASAGDDISSNCIIDGGNLRSDTGAFSVGGSLPAGVLAVTGIFYKISTGTIFEADIQFGTGGVDWSVNANNVLAPGASINTGCDGICNSPRAGDDVQEIPNGNGESGFFCISTGPNGVCNTARAGDDTQVIPVGQGAPNRAGVIVFLGATVPAGDDVALGNLILTGANGVCQTAANLLDVQVIPVGQGAPNTFCIDVGANGIRNTAVAGDDVGLTPNGTGFSFTTGVTAGPNLVLQTAAGGDDQIQRRVDLQSVATHEIGHWLGLAHPLEIVEADDKQEVNLSCAVAVGGTVVEAGANFLLDTTPEGDDQFDGFNPLIIVDGGNGISETQANNITLANFNGQQIMSPIFDSARRTNQVLNAQDQAALNFLYSPDLGDAPDPVAAAFNQYQTKVHTATNSRQLSGIQLFQVAKGPTHLYGFKGPGANAAFRFEWLGANMDDAAQECEARLVNADLFDDGVTMPVPLLQGVANTIRIRINHTAQAGRYVAADPRKRLYVNGYFDFNNDGLFNGADLACYWGGTPGTTASNSANFIGSVTFGNTIDLVFDITPPIGAPVLTYARFRLDYGEDDGFQANISGDLGLAVGAAQFGEVEDYLVRTIDAATIVTPVLYVKRTAAGANNGSSWADAFTDLQVALGVARASGGVVRELWVAADTYRPALAGGSRAATFDLVDGVGVYGGFAGNEVARNQRNPVANPTTLSGDLNGDDGAAFSNRTDNAWHVVTATGNARSAILDGFVISGGHADAATGDPDHNDVGGGIVMFAGNPTIRTCTVLDNYANYAGAGLYGANNSAPLISYSRFEHNRAAGNCGNCGGGGLYFEYSSNPYIANSDISFNAADPATAGGGLFCRDHCNATVVNCVLQYNGAGYGAASCAALDSDIQFFSTTFRQNNANAQGGAMYVYKANPTFQNCILWDNTAPLGPQIMIFSPPSNVTVDFSDVMGGPALIFVNAGCILNYGAGNIIANPLLNADGSIAAGSPCIDAGNLAFRPPDTADLDENANAVELVPVDKIRATRVVGPNMDMGAFEVAPARACCFAGGACVLLTPAACTLSGGIPNAPNTTCAPNPCPIFCLTGDANCDGAINNFDIDYFVIGILFVGSPVAPPQYLTIGGVQACWDQRQCWGDVNHDTNFNNFDIDSFVLCIINTPPIGQGCP